MQIANATAPVAVIAMDGTGNQTGTPGNPISVGDASVVAALGTLGTSIVAAVGAPPGANATQLSSNGTSTITGASIYYGLNVIVAGTLNAATVYDVTGTSSKIIGGAGALGLGIAATPAPNGIGVRLNGTLEVVLSGGIASTVNALWD